VFLLCREFILFVLAANLVAWPLAVFGLQAWLRNFPYATRLDPMLFLITGILSLLVALATVAYQSFKAAGTDPVSTLKHE
jgi:putative ABC transport system permease protein